MAALALTVFALLAEGFANQVHMAGEIFTQQILVMVMLLNSLRLLRAHPTPSTCH